MPSFDYTISSLTLLDGKTVELKDAVARAAIQGGTYFLGVTTTEIEDGTTSAVVTIAGDNVTAINGNMVVYGNKEFVYAAADTKWHELGDVTNLGDLALKDSASGSYTPAGEITFSGGTVDSTGTYTPAGEITFSGGTVNSTGTYTPEGTVTKPDITVSPTTATIKEFDGAGSVTNGSAASMVLPTWGATVTGENLAFSWSQGSFTPNTPTAVTLPTSKETSVMTGATAALDNAPVFSGSEASLSVSGTAAGTATFSGTEATLSVSGTAAGTATFSGTPATITVA